MASIEEVQAGIAQANDEVRNGLGALEQAKSSFERAQGLLTQATQGSSQSDADQANGLLARAIASVDEATQSASSATSTADGYAAGL
jgi:hypothetical protein